MLVALHGNVVDVGDEAGALTVREDTWIVVDLTTGIIVDYAVGEKPASASLESCATRTLRPNEMLCPGFVDTHVHAAQIQYQGTGTDLPLMEWLKEYAFPSEKRLTNDLLLSKTVYERLVDRLLWNGTTSCLYFGVLGVESTKVLVDVIWEKGQRAFVGKVNMNRLSPSDYCETAEVSLETTEHFINYVRSRNSESSRKPLVEPVVTPRFVPSCTEDLLSSLGELAKRTGCRVQSHAVESVDCLATVEVLHPNRGEVEILNDAGLLKEGTVMAHCVHANEKDIETFLENGVGIACCPLSNVYFAGGALRARALMGVGVKVGLGTDVAGGYSHRMLDSVRHSVTTHLSVCASDDNEASGRCAGFAPGFGGRAERDSFGWKHAVWLATAGGAKVLGMETCIGKLRKGFEFDALVIDVSEFEDPLGEDKATTTFERFVHLGDDRHISEVWVQGRRVK
jgi:guanine deaminase